MKTELNDAVATLIRTRDFCGDEGEALADWEADNRKLTTQEWLEVVIAVENNWNAYRKMAGVHKFNLSTNSHWNPEL